MSVSASHLPPLVGRIRRQLTKATADAHRENRSRIPTLVLPVVFLLVLTTIGVACAPAASGATASEPATTRTTGTTSGVASAAASTVNMTSALKFEPSTLTIPKGTTVTWRNTGAVGHTVTDDPAKAANKADAALPSGVEPWDSGNINPGGTFQRTFDTPGTYTYFCIPHEAAGMVATITVTD
jgi:plastocyanin